MRVPLRRWAAIAGSGVALLIVILLVSADARTAVALSAFVVLGVVGQRFVRSSPRLEPVRSRLTPRRTRLLGVVVAAALVLAIADDVVEALWLVAITVLGSVGYRGGDVVRGAAYGTAVGADGASVVVVSTVVLLLTATVLGVPGMRRLAVQVLFAPHVVGFVSALSVASAVAVGGAVGLASGTAGGAIARFVER